MYSFHVYNYIILYDMILYCITCYYIILLYVIYTDDWMKIRSFKRCEASTVFGPAGRIGLHAASLAEEG